MRPGLNALIFYADTSFLFSLFVPDSNSGQATSSFELMEGPLSLSKLNELELGNAISLAIFQRRIDLQGANRARRRVEEDFASGVLIEAAVDWEEAFARAALLSLEEAPLIGCRSLDLLQVAIAQVLAADIFLSFDVRQRTVATRAGLDVQPSSTPP